MEPRTPGVLQIDDGQRSEGDGLLDRMACSALGACDRLEKGAASTVAGYLPEASGLHVEPCASIVQEVLDRGGAQKTQALDA